MSVKEQCCPSWCVKEHLESEITSHEGEVQYVELLSGEADPQFLEIRTVQYLPIGTDESSSAPASMVEVALHSGNRYRVFNLAGNSVHALARVLLSAASAINSQHTTSEA